MLPVILTREDFPERLDVHYSSQLEIAIHALVTVNTLHLPGLNPSSRNSQS